MLNFLSNKSELITKYRTHEKDSGSVFVQVALLCARIQYLSKHTENNKGDHSAKRSLLTMIQKRRRLLEGSFAQSKEMYHKIISDFGLRDSIDKKNAKAKLK